MHTGNKKTHIKLLLCLLIAILTPTANIFTFNDNFTALATDNVSMDEYETNGVKDFNIHSKGGIVMDANTGNILYAKNPNTRYYPASCTKVLTAIVVLENCKNLDEVMTVSPNAVHGIDPTSSHIALDEGEKITVRQGLYGLLLCSGNDCAVALAEHVGGSVKGFSDMMNNKVDELGLKNTHFENPHGLFGKTHYTTPSDLAKIMRYCMQNPEFVKIDSTLKYVIPKTNKSKKRELWNNHKMIKNKYYAYDGVTGGKTGYIDKSQFNLITCAQRGDMKLISVNMRCINPIDIVKDTKKEFNFYFKRYKSANVSAEHVTKKDIKAGNLKIDYDIPSDLNVIMPIDMAVSELKFDIKEKENLSLPIKKGDVVGEILVSSGNHILSKGELKATKNLSYLNHFTNIIFPYGIIIPIIFFIILFIVMRKKYRKRYRRM